MAEKKYKGRRAYLNDFKKNVQGEYEYQGNLYQWKASKKEKKTELGKLCFLGIGLLFLLCAAVCLDAPGALNCIYVIVPSSVSFVLGISVAWGIVRFCAAKDPIREYIYKATVEAVNLRCFYTMIGTGTAFAGEVLYLLLHGAGEKFSGALLFLSAEAAGFLGALFIRKRMMHIAGKIEKMSNGN